MSELKLKMSQNITFEVWQNPTTPPLSVFSDLTHARRVAAWLVETLGDEYWPAFDGLDREVESRRGRENRLHNALTAN